MEQVRELVAPEQEDAATGGDAFDSIVAGLGGIGLGISLSAADQAHAGHELTGDGPEPRDPALDRIFPTANRQDEQAAAEFRRLTEETLRGRKTANLDTALAALSGVQEQR